MFQYSQDLIRLLEGLIKDRQPLQPQQPPIVNVNVPEQVNISELITFMWLISYVIN